MKLLLSTSALLFAFALSAQTNIIQTRSHSGDIAESLVEPDNYGMPMIEIEIDSVILLNSNCLIEVKTYDGMHRQRDTICDHPYLKGTEKDLNDIKKLYPSSTKFEGFKSRKRANNDQSMFFNGPGILGGIMMLLIGLFVGIPRIRH